MKKLTFIIITLTVLSGCASQFYSIMGEPGAAEFVTMTESWIGQPAENMVAVWGGHKKSKIPYGSKLTFESFCPEFQNSTYMSKTGETTDYDWDVDGEYHSGSVTVYRDEVTTLTERNHCVTDVYVKNDGTIRAVTSNAGSECCRLASDGSALHSPKHRAFFENNR